jgi:8-oxo-dGTP pyrophosphatase MutT (NUDIX family)
MTKEYSAEERKVWRASQPQKMIVVKAIITSDKGNILLVKPDYKQTWQFLGGTVENGESLEAAAVRETQEELGLTLSEDSLTIMATIYKKDEEILFVIYKSSELFPEDIDLKIEVDGITGYQFVEPHAVSGLLESYYTDFWDNDYLKSSEPRG